jgi:hypothetical protein
MESSSYTEELKSSDSAPPTLLREQIKEAVGLAVGLTTD